MNSVLLGNIQQALFVFLYGLFVAFGVVELRKYKNTASANELDMWFAITYIAVGEIGLILSIIRFVIR